MIGTNNIKMFNQEGYIQQDDSNAASSFSFFFRLVPSIVSSGNGR
jgi:hypothetical protein